MRRVRKAVCHRVQQSDQPGAYHHRLRQPEETPPTPTHSPRPQYPARPPACGAPAPIRAERQIDPDAGRDRPKRTFSWSTFATVGRKAAVGHDVMSPQENRFAFDHCYGTDTEQPEVFADLGTEMLNKALEGFNGTIFAYGQTGGRCTIGCVYVGAI